MSPTSTVQLKVPAPDPLGVTMHVPVDPMLAPGPIEKETVIAPPVPVLGVNPEPFTVTSTPLEPLFGEREIVGVVRVKEDRAESKLPSDPVAVIV